MRYLAIYSVGYGGQGPWKINFEIEANAPDEPVIDVFEYKGNDAASISDLKRLIEKEPELTAQDLSMQSGGQFIGFLADKETGKVVSENKDILDEEDQYPWELLNTDPLMQQ